MAGFLDDWLCPRCGTSNDSFRSYCQGCQGRKSDMAEEFAASESPAPPSTSVYTQMPSQLPPPPAPGAPGEWSLPPPPGPSVKRKRWPFVLLALGGLAVLGIIGAVVFLSSEDPAAKRDATALEAAALTADDLGPEWFAPTPVIDIATRGGFKVEAIDDEVPCFTDDAFQDEVSGLVEDSGRAGLTQNLEHRNDEGGVAAVIATFDDPATAAAWNGLFTTPTLVECLRAYFEESAQAGAPGTPISAAVEPRASIAGAQVFRITISVAGQSFAVEMMTANEGRAAIQLFAYGLPTDPATMDRLGQTILDRLRLQD